MPRYIDADALKNLILNDMAQAEREGKDLNGYTDALFHIKTIPTADVAEVRHGKWKKSEYAKYDYFCSVCRVWTMLRCYGNHDDLTKYCPNCGAKMDGERSER